MELFFVTQIHTRAHTHTHTHIHTHIRVVICARRGVSVVCTVCYVYSANS